MGIFNNLIIFEMANSHQGSVEHGLAIIDEMSKITQDFKINSGVKFQFRDLDSFIHIDYRRRDDIKHISRFESTRLDKSQFKFLVEKVKETGMLAISTPFDESGVDWCKEFNIDIIKIASSSANDWPLLEKASLSGIPMIVSTGGKTIEEIDKVYNFLLHRNVKFSLLHCVSEYPVESINVQLNFIDVMKKRYPDIVIGYSGHESPNDTIIARMAIAKGSEIMERHVGIPNDNFKLNSYSMDPSQSRKWVESIVEAVNTCILKGTNEKFISEVEKASLQSLERGVYLKKDTQKGKVLSLDDVYFAMPLQENQTPASGFGDKIKTTLNYKKDSPLYDQRSPSIISSTRKLIHLSKGLLNEAGIKTGINFTVELSHHYGLDLFSDYGATILNFFNREYSKKLIIVLPNQEHPSHFHKIKEEAFQLLYGDLKLIIDGVEYNLLPGDHKIILRNQVHSFKSFSGAVFEEIATTHIVGDSYYLDSKISKLDLIERKTIIEEW